MTTFDMRKGKLASAVVYQEFFPLKTGDVVANIGCGAGPQAVIYRNQYALMVGVDINLERLQTADVQMKHNGIIHYLTACANVERLPLPDGAFDRVLAIDIIEHVQHPDVLCSEMGRVLRKDGELLITFPALHDGYVALFSRIGRLLGRKPKTPSNAFVQAPDEWHPDAHNQHHDLDTWITLVERSGFELVRARASTLFPPLHLYGVPRFWFTNPLVRRVDGALSGTRLLRRYGQALVAVFRKRPIRA